MAQETKQDSPAPKKVPKLSEKDRANVARALRQMLTVLKSDIKPAMKFVEDSVMKGQLSTNEEMAELEAAFDVIRDAAKAVPYKTHVEKAEILLLGQLNRDLPSFKVEGAGTVSDSRRKYWSMKNPEQFIAFAEKQGDFEGFTTSVADAWCNEYYKKTGKRPPGTDFWEKHSLSFTAEKKSKSKK